MNDQLYPKTDGLVPLTCPCAHDKSWNVPAHTIPICSDPEYGTDGICNNCEHAKACHEQGFQIDYRAHAEALAEVLQGLVENAWASCEVEGDQLVGRATQDEWDAHCAATDRACATLAAYNKAKGGV